MWILVGEVRETGDGLNEKAAGSRKRLGLYQVDTEIELMSPRVEDEPWSHFHNVTVRWSSLSANASRLVSPGMSARQAHSELLSERVLRSPTTGPRPSPRLLLSGP